MAIRGNKGTTTFQFEAGLAVSAIIQAVNLDQQATGVEAYHINSGNPNSGISFRSVQFGLDQFVEITPLATGGAYIPAGTRAYDLGQIYEDHLAGLARGEIRAEKRKRYREQFQLFVFLGVIILLVEMAVPSYRRLESPAGGTSGRSGALNRESRAGPGDAGHLAHAFEGVLHEL